jgi:hypothetical protein
MRNQGISHASTRPLLRHGGRRTKVQPINLVHYAGEYKVHSRRAGL